ncbi:hypothetical protein Btru_044206 [Bulinus truncatus]|nr:hypothetical protein Btru_044206 [Bulinus truncatus]
MHVRYGGLMEGAVSTSLSRDCPVVSSVHSLKIGIVGGWRLLDIWLENSGLVFDDLLVFPVKPLWTHWAQTRTQHALTQDTQMNLPNGQRRTETVNMSCSTTDRAPVSTVDEHPVFFLRWLIHNSITPSVVFDYTHSRDYSWTYSRRTGRLASMNV